MTRIATLAIATLAIATLALGLFAAPAFAEDAMPTATTLFGTLNGKPAPYACFKRTYDADHLAAHPQQNVRQMLVFVAASRDPETPIHSIGIGVYFRSLKQRFDVSGSCSASADHPGGLECGVDCDGGHISIRQRDAASVLVEIPHGAQVTEPGDDNAPKNARFKADDKLFKLDRAAARDCLSIVFDEDLKKEIQTRK